MKGVNQLYSNLLEYYDELFPVEQNRLDFIESIAVKRLKASGSGGPARILDLGCATGTTDIQLMRRGMDITGIDNNDLMIQSANRRNPEPKTNARFFLMDMTGMDAYFPKSSFDIVLCLGNTLAHLKNAAEIEQQIKSVQSVLKPGGVFIFQLINYDWVLAERIIALPVIETIRSRLIRKYTHTTDKHILFDISVLSSNGQTVFNDSVSLYPVTSRELLKALHSSGFDDETLYSNFDKDPVERFSLSIVGTAVKV